MKNIQEIFENSIFRIPDYQRGYAWKQEHLDDFWQDLQNLRKDKFHYTGALTLEDAKPENTTRWKGDEWIVVSGSYKPFYIVDGQQRITTIIILLNILIDGLAEEEQYLYQPKKDLVAKYIYKRNERDNLQSYIFGYEVDDPSYEYLKTKIFKQSSTESLLQPETFYTQNLHKADKFFRELINELSFEEKELLFKKVTQLLRFDIKEIKDDLDIFVVFETMNNRGKPLTNLEKLKNRLIYLSTVMPDANAHERKELRHSINRVWKSCYEYLGKNKENSLNDDNFLRNHFVIFHFFHKERDYPYKDLFKDVYTVQNTVNNEPGVNFASIKGYIESLQKSAK